MKCKGRQVVSRVNAVGIHECIRNHGAVGYIAEVVKSQVQLVGLKTKTDPPVIQFVVTIVITMKT